MTAPIVGFKERIADRRVAVAALWAEGLTVREIGKRLLPDPTHDEIIRHDLKRLGIDPRQRKGRGTLKEKVRKQLLLGRNLLAREIAAKVGCATTYVHLIARDLRAEGVLPERPSAAEVAERRAAWYAKELKECGNVPLVAAKLGVTEAAVYFALNSHGYSVRDIREGVAA